MRFADSLDVLRDRRFAWFFTARTISLVGSTLVAIPLLFAVMDIDSSGLALAQVVAARTLAMVVFILFGGAVSDRLDRVLVLRVAHLATALSQGAAAALILTGRATIASLIIVEAFNGAVSAFTMPAMQGIVPRVVPADRLQPANALLGMSRNALGVVGPLLGSYLVTTVGSGWGLAADALSYAVAWAILGRVTLGPAPVPPPVPGPMLGSVSGADPVSGSVPDPIPAEPTGLIAELRGGWSEFVSRTWVWAIVAAFLVLNAITAGGLMVIGPLVAKQDLGPEGWGQGMSAEGLGLLVATAFLLKIRLRRPLVAGMLAVVWTALPMFALGMRWAIPWVVIAFFISGIASDIFNIGWTVALQENIPDRLLARVSSYDMLGSFIAMPVGQIGFGWLSTHKDVHGLLVWSCAVYVVVALLTLLSRDVRRLRSPGSSLAHPEGDEGEAGVQ